MTNNLLPRFFCRKMYFNYCGYSGYWRNLLFKITLCFQQKIQLTSLKKLVMRESSVTKLTSFTFFVLISVLANLFSFTLHHSQTTNHIKLCFIVGENVKNIWNVSITFWKCCGNYTIYSRIDQLEKEWGASVWVSG